MEARARRLGRRAAPWSETDHLQLLHDLVEQVRHALPVLGRDFQHRVETEPVDLEGCVLRAFVVSLVDGHNHRMPGLPQVGHNHLIRGNQSFAPVDDQNQQIGRAIARWPWRTTSSCKGSSLAPKRPPVSNSSKETFRHVTGRPSASRVVPATGATIARREPEIRLKSVDLPTLGRPTSATVGNAFKAI